MTLTQLSAFVLVARLGTVKAAASALGVSEPAVSQAIAALRRYLDDPLLTRSANGMELTPGGSRLLTIAAQMVSLGAEAESAVRSAQGAADRLRLVAPSPLVEFVAGPLADAFTARSGGSIEVSAGVSATAEMSALVAQRLADVALGPDLSGGPGLVSEPIFRARIVVLAAPDARPPGPPSQWPWLVDPSATDPRQRRQPDAARASACRSPGSRSSPTRPRRGRPPTRGAGVAPAIAHLAVHQLRRRELQVVDVPGTPLDLCWHVTTLAADRRSAPPRARCAISSARRKR